MKGFTREHPELALCGLSCALCTMHIGGYCPGCGGGSGNQACAMARCSLEHGVEWCCHCPDYPCGRYEGIDEHDSFISHRNQTLNLERVRTQGADACLAELAEKRVLLDRLLAHYNAGRQKSPFAVAADLLDLPTLRAVLAALEAEAAEAPQPDRAKAALAALQAAAKERGLDLKLRKKPKT